MKLRVVTTHGEYVCTVPKDDPETRGVTGEDFADQLGEIIGTPADRAARLKLKVDGIGWVAINPHRVVAVEMHEEES